MCPVLLGQIKFVDLQLQLFLRANQVAVFALRTMFEIMESTGFIGQIKFVG
jgi:hypothetical protein